MYSKITKTVVAAESGSQTIAEIVSISGMETRNHISNGVSPKNHRSRGNFWMLVVLALAFFIGTNTAAGQTWDIGHNPVPGGEYLSTVKATLNGNTLTISGEGNMADFFCTGANQYNAGGEAPWNPYYYPNAFSIQYVVIENGVTNIGMRAFKDLGNLKSVTIPPSVTNINGQAFKDCSQLQTVTIQNGTTPITFKGYNLNTPCPTGNPPSPNTYDWFDGCTSLSTLHLGRNANLGSSSSNSSPISQIKNTLTTLTIGSTVTEIESEAFNNCEKLKTVTIEDGNSTADFLTFKGYNTNGHFKNAHIETLYLGKNLTQITH